MSHGVTGVIEVSRRVDAPAHAIFKLLSHPERHVDIDGSDMLRGTVTSGPLTSVGDSFVMNMYYEQFGDYQMKNVVVDFVEDRRIAWEPARHDLPAADDDDHWHHRWGFALEPDGDGATLVTEFYDCTRSPEEPRARMKDGAVWEAAMSKTLENLAAIMEDETGSSSEGEAGS